MLWWVWERCILWLSIHNLVYVGPMDETWSVVARFQTGDCFIIIVSGTRKSLNCWFIAVSVQASQHYIDRLVRSWIETANCSQNVFRCSTSLSNVGTSSFGSFTPLLSTVDLEKCENREVSSYGVNNYITTSQVLYVGPGGHYHLPSHAWRVHHVR